MRARPRAPPHRWTRSSSYQQCTASASAVSAATAVDVHALIVEGHHDLTLCIVKAASAMKRHGDDAKASGNPLQAAGVHGHRAVVLTTMWPDMMQAAPTGRRSMSRRHPPDMVTGRARGPTTVGRLAAERREDGRDAHLSIPTVAVGRQNRRAASGRRHARSLRGTRQRLLWRPPTSNWPAGLRSKCFKYASREEWASDTDRHRGIPIDEAGAAWVERRS